MSVVLQSSIVHICGSDNRSPQCGKRTRVVIDVRLFVTRVQRNLHTSYILESIGWTQSLVFGATNCVRIADKNQESSPSDES